jgi:hypothetical protein
LPPVPVITRWNSWFKTAIHHTEYIDFYGEFVSAELKIGESQALTELQQLLANAVLVSDVKFIASNGDKLVDDLTWFESSCVNIHLAYNKATDLLAWAEWRTADPNPRFVLCPKHCLNVIVM